MTVGVDAIPVTLCLCVRVHVRICVIWRLCLQTVWGFWIFCGCVSVSSVRPLSSDLPWFLWFRTEFSKWH